MSCLYAHYITKSGETGENNKVINLIALEKIGFGEAQFQRCYSTTNCFIIDTNDITSWSECFEQNNQTPLTCRTCLCKMVQLKFKKCNFHIDDTPILHLFKCYKSSLYTQPFLNDKLKLMGISGRFGKNCLF